MANRRSAALDECFGALSHPLRREILDHLLKGPSTIGRACEGFKVAAPTISRHLDVLERAGLVRRERVGRDHVIRLGTQPLREATSWMSRYSRFWDERLDALEELIAKLDDPDERQAKKERNR